MGNSQPSPDQLPPVHDGQHPPSLEGTGWEQAASHVTFSQVTSPFWHQHWEHPGSVQRLPESYVAPRCQQAEDPGATCVAAGPLGKDGDPSCGCKGGPRVPKREARGMGVATSRVGTDGKDVGSTGVGEGRLVVLTPAGGPGAPEGGLCPGERAGRPASGSSRSILGGGCRGCRMADGASTAFGKASQDTRSARSLKPGRHVHRKLPTVLWQEW